MAALLGAVGGFGEEDEAGAGAPGWFALDSGEVLVERVHGIGWRYGGVLDEIAEGFEHP